MPDFDNEYLHYAGFYSHVPFPVSIYRTGRAGGRDHAYLTHHNEQLAQSYDAIENLLDEKTEQKSWDERERIGFRP